MEEHEEARSIVQKLADEGFVAYYAGGWVRDLLLNHPSDDIDIATNAPPETIQALFEKTVPIGIQFGIILVLIGKRQYEVATFRQDLDYQDGRRPTKIAFTTAAEDAKRRDFTINGMFYDPLKDEILDFVEGKIDLEKKLIRAIGEPHERIREDRLRMIRAIRLASRFHFKLEKKTEAAIRAHVKELFPAVAIERVWQEFVKSHNFGHLSRVLVLLHDFGLLQEIFPELTNELIETIKKRVEPIRHYPKAAPVIASILALFPNSSKEKQLEICRKLKLSNADMTFTLFLYHAHKLIQETRPIERFEWAYFYANPLASITLQILSAHLDSRKQTAFLKNHEYKMEELAPFIQRIKDANPVVKSGHLKDHGIESGPSMGKLLQEADRISVNEALEEPEDVIEKLKKMPLWPK